MKFPKVRVLAAVVFVIGGLTAVIIAGPGNLGSSGSSNTSAATPAASPVNQDATIPSTVLLFDTPYAGAELVPGTQVQLICGNGSAAAGYSFRLTVLSGAYEGTTGIIEVPPQSGSTLSAPWSATQACS